MSEQVVVREPHEGRTLLVGGGDYVTYKVRSAETDGAYFCFEASTTPGVHQPAALEEFFEEFGVPVARAGELPEDLEPPDHAAMAAALERNGVRVVGVPSTIG